MSFLSISGSDFVEMFVGVGASRVRDMFEQGKKMLLVSYSSMRLMLLEDISGAGLGGGNDERSKLLTNY